MFDRRQFLKFTGGLTLGTIVSANSSIVLAMSIPESELQIQAWTPEGEPLDKKNLNQLYFLELNDEPLPTPKQRIELGKLFSQPPPSPFAIGLRMPVRGFGDVVLYADNEGRGYTPVDFPLDLNVAFARSRLHRLTLAISNWSRVGIEFPATITARLTKAREYLQAAEEADTISLRAKMCDRSLFESLWAGEEAVFNKAKQIIAERGHRPNFLFGCNFFGFDSASSEYNRRFKQLFNFATVPFYWKPFEPKPGQQDFAKIDAMVNWLQQEKITPKGHPLVWFHEVGIPDWLRSKSYQEIKQAIERRVYQITAHYGAKIPYYDIINEANGLPWANDLNYNLEQFLELTRLASTVSRAGNPDIVRIINSCCLWAENVPYEKPPQISPYQYLKACLAAEIPFETIGLQLYYPDRDMFEIDRLLERFSTLGKTIHITELGVSSATNIDETSYLKQPKGLWHEPWNEQIQADWLEQFYTICYSKPYIEAISWWDFADRGNFLPHGGLLDRDFKPKQSFDRLANLLQQWNQNPIEP